MIENGGVVMSENKETPEKIREELRREEIKKNPSGNAKDALQRAETGNLPDLVGSLGWKGFGILILVIIIGFIIASLFLK